MKISSPNPIPNEQTSSPFTTVYPNSVRYITERSDALVATHIVHNTIDNGDPTSLLLQMKKLRPERLNDVPRNQSWRPKYPIF